MDEMNVKQLRRTKNGRVIAGVCSGVGRYVGVDPNVLRIGLGIATLFGGLGIGIYAVAWVLVPDEDRPASIVQDLIDKNKDNPNWVDAKHKAQEGWEKAQAGWNRKTKTTTPPADPYAQHPYTQPTDRNDVL